MEVMLMLVLAGLDIMSSSVECVWRRGWERFRLLSAHTSLLLLSRARLLSLAGLTCL